MPWTRLRSDNRLSKMSLSRKLLTLIVAVQLTALGLIATQLHFKVTGQYRAFDAANRTTTRAEINAAIEQHYLRAHAEARYWLDQHADSVSRALAGFAVTAPPYAQHILQDNHTVSLLDAGGAIVWSNAAPGVNWAAADFFAAPATATTLLTHRNTGTGIDGIVASPTGPLLAHSLALADGAGKIVGYLVLTRELNAAFFANQVFLNERALQLYTTASAGTNPTVTRLLDAEPVTEGELNQLEAKDLQAYTVLRNRAGEPLAVLAVASPKFSSLLDFNPGLEMMLYIVLTSLLSLLVIASITQKLIGRPLQALKRKVLDSLESEPSDTITITTGQDIGHIELIFDRLIDERRKREARLRFFASAVDVADDAIAIIDRGGRLHFVNPGFERLTGYSSAELLQKNSWWELAFEDMVMNHREHRRDEWEGTLKIRRSSGDVCEVEATTYQVDVGPDGSTYFVLALHDVTETNRQMAEIQRLATAVETIEDCIIIADPDGRICYANPAYVKRCDTRLEDMMGVQTNALAHAASPPEVYAELTQTVLAGNAWRGELRAVFRDGREVIDEAVVSPVANDQGEVVNYVTTLHDVTQRVSMARDLRLAKERIEQTKEELEERVNRRTEELRIAKEAAEAANVAKSAFLATVSHEIRTPLNGILGMLELLGDHPLDPEQLRLLGSANTSAGLLLSLINDILDFSKIEADQLTLDEIAVSLREVTETVVLSLASIAHRKGIRLQSSLQPDLPAAVTVDGVRLQQILLNLLGNALKFTSSSAEHDGMVTLQVDEVRHSSNRQRMLRFRVKDSGIGIPAEAVDSLFKPFTQAESSTTRRFGGTGLGLSISSKLVEMMGGEISVTTELNKGSEFTVLLPLVEAAETDTVELPTLAYATEEPCSPAWDATAARGTVLIAEDNPINQDVIRLQLKAIGFDSHVAADGREALKLWQNGSYDLVLTDCHMPNMDGFALARAIRAAETPGQRVPIVALTANVLSEEAQRCRAAGMDECLTKPIQRKRLDKALTVHLTTSVLARSAAAQQPAAPADIDIEAELAALECPPDGSEGLLDMQAFADNLGCDIEVQHELLRRFAEEATRNLLDSADAAAARDADRLKCNAHKMKSAARTLGAESVADACVQIEKACANPDWPRLNQLLEQESLLIARLGRQIRIELERHGAPAKV